MNHTVPIALTSVKEIASLPVFLGVEPEIMRDLIAATHGAMYHKGSIILKQGAPVSRFYIILDGWCGACKGNAEGQEAILQLFHRGDFLLEPGSAEIMETSPLNLQALTSVQILTLPHGALRTAMERSPVLIANLLATNVRRCQELREHIEQLALHSAEQRVGRFLLQVRFNATTEGNEIVLPFDKSLVAAYLGIKPETFSRTLQSFRERGFVIERGHLTVPSRDALCGYCDAFTMHNCPFAHTEQCVISANKALAEL
jgi:CRP-like cAMP-binding protein